MDNVYWTSSLNVIYIAGAVDCQIAGASPGGFGTILLFCFDYSDNPKAWQHSMELLAKEVMPKFKGLVPK